MSEGDRRKPTTHSHSRLKGVAADDLITVMELTLNSISPTGSVHETHDGKVCPKMKAHGISDAPRSTTWNGQRCYQHVVWEIHDNFWAQYSAINLQATNKNGELVACDQGGSVYDSYSQESGVNAILAAAAWGWVPNLRCLQVMDMVSSQYIDPVLKFPFIYT
ncbi:hypothetical protein B0H14DRAFT_2629447 [Mycena olivaceomarginata]|nr:hypothetical protein B0H14DRAFT_2629447 [Mycena olivaceomarginata]